MRLLRHFSHVSFLHAQTGISRLAGKAKIRKDRASRALRLINSPPLREGEFPSLIKKGGREWLLQRIGWDRTWDALLVSALIGAPAKADFQPAVPAPFPPARCLAH